MRMNWRPSKLMMNYQFLKLDNKLTSLYKLQKLKECSENSSSGSSLDFPWGSLSIAVEEAARKVKTFPTIPEVPTTEAEKLETERLEEKIKILESMQEQAKKKILDLERKVAKLSRCCFKSTNKGCTQNFSFNLDISKMIPDRLQSIQTEEGHTSLILV